MSHPVVSKILARVWGPSEKGALEMATGGPARLEPPAPAPPARRALQDPAHEAQPEQSRDTTARLALPG